MKKLIGRLKLQRIESIIFSAENNHARKSNKYILPANLNLHIYSAKNKSGNIKIDKKLSAGNVCYSVMSEKGLIVHQSWIFKKKLLTRQLGFKLAYTIGDCWTIPEFRGKGIYTYVLDVIKNDNLGKSIVIYCATTNAASIRGIEKAGFTKLYHFSLTRLLGLKIKFQIHEHFRKTSL
ncbi:MAG: hypothetical protein WAU24_13045 [Chitinophagaceae bacterium]